MAVPLKPLKPLAADAYRLDGGPAMANVELVFEIAPRTALVSLMSGTVAGQSLPTLVDARAPQVPAPLADEPLAELATGDPSSVNMDAVFGSAADVSATKVAEIFVGGIAWYAAGTADSLVTVPTV